MVGISSSPPGIPALQSILNNKFLPLALLLGLESFCKDFLEFKSELSDINIKKVFRLHPPHKGYEATKKPYTLGGTLGPRYNEINGLIQKMI